MLLKGQRETPPRWPRRARTHFFTAFGVGHRRLDKVPSSRCAIQAVYRRRRRLHYRRRRARAFRPAGRRRQSDDVSARKNEVLVSAGRARRTRHCQLGIERAPARRRRRHAAPASPGRVASSRRLSPLKRDNTSIAIAHGASTAETCHQRRQQMTRYRVPRTPDARRSRGDGRPARPP